MADVAQLNVRVSSDTSKAIRGLLGLNAQLAQLSRQASSSHNAVRQLSGDLDGNTNALNRNSAAATKSGKAFGSSASSMGRMGRMVMMAAKATIVLYPVLQGIVAVAGGLVSALTSAGVAGGVFGLAMMGATKGAVAHRDAVKTTAAELKAAKTTLKQTEKGTAEYGVALADVTRLQEKMHTTTQQLTSSDSYYLNSLKILKSGFDQFVAATAPTTLLIASRVLITLGQAVQKLVPLVGAVAPVFENVANSLDHWVSIRMDSWVKFFATTGLPILTSLVTIGKNVAAVFGDMIKQFSGFGGSIFNSIALATAKLKSWADGGGFAAFMDKVSANGPAIKDFFSALGDLISKANGVLSSFGSTGITATALLMKLINIAPVGLIQALTYAWIAYGLALKVYAAYTAIAGAATWAFSTAQGASHAQMGLLRVQMALLWVQQKAMAIWTGIVTAAQWAWNASLYGCPALLVVALIAALVAAIVLIATKTTWFQTAWTYAWNFIKQVTSDVWNWLLANVFQPIGNFFTVTIPAWCAVFTRAFNSSGEAIRSGLSASWNWILANVINPIGSFFTVIIPGWGNTLKNSLIAAWNTITSGISTAWQWLLNNVIYPIGRFFTQTIPGWAETLRAIAIAKWNQLIQGFAAGFNWVKANVFSPIGTFFVTTIPGWANTLKNLVVARWNDLKNGISGVWNWIKSNIFSPIGNFFTKTIPGWANILKNSLVSAFNQIKDGIKKAWNLLEGIFKAPIKFMIDVVFNKGIVGLWNNTAAKLPGIGNMKTMALPKGFAEGGHTGGGAKLQPAGVVHADEFVVKKSSRRAIESTNPGALDYMNRNGRMPGYDEGGPVDTRVIGGGGPGGGSSGHTVKGGTRPDGTTQGNNGINIPGALSKGFDWASGVLRTGAAEAFKATWNAVVNPLKALVPGSTQSPELTKGVKAWPDKIRDMAYNLIKGKEDDLVGGGNVADAVKWADSQIGKPYQYGGGMDPSFDCSSFMSSIAKVIMGKDPHGRQWSTMDFQGTSAPAGWKYHDKSPFMIGVTNGPSGSGGKEGHTAGTLAGTNYEATPPVLRKGPGARGYDDSMFDAWYGFSPAKGGGGSSTGKWQEVAGNVLKELGMYSAGNLALLIQTIAKESGGNPNAVNNYDSNAAAGMPSKGLAQVIDPTFKTFAGPYGNRSIFDPYANIYAAVSYAKAYYGSNALQRMAQPGGYYTGGLAKGWSVVGEKGPELINAGSGSRVLSNKQSQDAISATGSGNGGDSYHFSFDGAIIASDIQLEDLVVKAVKSATRKKRLK